MRVTIQHEAISHSAMEAKIRTWRYSRRLPERIAADWAQQMIDGKLRRGDEFPDRLTMDEFHVKAINTLLTAKRLLAESGWAARSSYHRQWVPMAPLPAAAPER